MLCYSLQPLPQHIQTAPGSLDRAEAEVEESSKLHVLLAVSTLTISGIAHAGD